MPIHTHARARAHLRLASCSFYLPVACGFILAGGVFAETGTLKAAEDICVLMGEYFQVQDDFLDAYADAAVLGKVGTDIQDGKCSWLVVQALAAADAPQRAALTAHYGRAAPESVAAVKALYAALRLDARFEDYERNSHAELVALIAKVAAETGVPAGVFEALLAKIYKRQK